MYHDNPLEQVNNGEYTDMYEIIVRTETIFIRVWVYLPPVVPMPIEALKES